MTPDPPPPAPDATGAPTPAAAPPAGRRFGFVAAVLAIQFAHAAGLVAIFETPSDLWNAEPLVEQDYGLHFHHLKSMQALRAAEGRGWGYNPLFMAGYVSNTIQDASIKLFEFAALAAPDPVRAFKLLAILSAALWPAALFAAGALLFGDLKPAALMALLGTAYWWNSHPREMFFYGMIGFPAASLACTAAVAAAMRFLADLSAGASRGRLAAWWLLWTALCAALPALHMQSAIILLPPAVAAIARETRKGNLDGVGWLAMGAALGVAANIPWLRVFFLHYADDISADIAQELNFFIARDPAAFIKDYLGLAPLWSFRETRFEGVARLALLAAALAGFRGWLRAGRSDLAAPWIAAAAAMFALAYFGSLVSGLAAWQPLRFKIPLDLALLPAAAAWLAQPPAHPCPALLRAAQYAAGAIAVAAFCANVASVESSGALRMRAGLPPAAREIIAWAEALPHDGRRILFEESGDESGFAYGGVYLSSFLAHMAGRELIGGPANFYNDARSRTRFYSGRLLGRPIGEIPAQQLARILEVYNVGAIVAHDARSAERLLALGGLTRLERRLGNIALIRVERPPRPLIAGEGSVRAEIGRIECRGLAGAEVILKHRWVRGLVSEPPATIEPYWLPGFDDPTPFIRIVNPPRDLTLRIGPR